MRIALYHNLPSGGAKRTVAAIAKRLAPSHQVDVYTLSSSDHEFADLSEFVTASHVTRFRPLPLLRSPFGRLNQVIRCLDVFRLRRVAKRIARDIDRRGYDVAFVHPCQFEQAPSVLRYLGRTPSVYYCQEPPRVVHEATPARPSDGDGGGPRRLLNSLDPLPALYRRLLRESDRANTRSAGTVLVNSAFSAGVVARVYGILPLVSYLGVDAEGFAPVACEKRQMVLSVGSLTPLKGFDFLVRAMASYPVESRPSLVIASNFQNPPERAYLLGLAHELGVELVLTGCVSDAGLRDLYNLAKVVACAPIREPFGLVPLEAMACQTPVVAVAEGGMRESVVDGETGFLAERDPEQFAAQVRRLVEDSVLARRLGANGRAHVLREWTWEHAAARIEGHLVSRSREESAAKPAVVAFAD